MDRVRLAASEINRETPDVILKFIHKANDQGFDLDWVEMVVEELLHTSYENWRDVLLKYSEIDTH